MKRKIGLFVVAVLVGLQFVPVDRGNPPIRSDFSGPAEVKEILQRSCYDCHSNETRWPWYSRVAPVSFLVAGDVKEGREHLNFSDWGAYDGAARAKLGAEVLEVVEKREMPLPIYVLLHGEAKLTGSELTTLRGWRP
ncbi:MAG: heme-binding domain-containing protein [Krumholzibacteria bacterium]|nr:heme-binding domain-containing protein [Candidatus Krumholzibacteria bacterium]